jgi:hypothetical protein
VNSMSLSALDPVNCTASISTGFFLNLMPSPL